MSANPDLLETAEFNGSSADATEELQPVAGHEAWNAESFAREQIRILVRRLFFNATAPPIKQVVFSAVSSDPDVSCICEQVGRALSLETSADVAVVGPRQRRQEVRFRRYTGEAAKSSSVRIGANLWRVAESWTRADEVQSGIGRYWLSRLAELRAEFDYAVIQGPMAGASSEAALLGEISDGIVLVLGGKTRRAAVRKVKESLEITGSRILGTVLSDRAFPIPERIYRRL
jgi:hypothetical protein